MAVKRKDIRLYKHITVAYGTWEWLKQQSLLRGTKGVGTVIDQLVEEYQEAKKKERSEKRGAR